MMDRTGVSSIRLLVSAARRMSWSPIVRVPAALAAKSGGCGSAVINEVRNTGRRHRHSSLRPLSQTPELALGRSRAKELMLGQADISRPRWESLSRLVPVLGGLLVAWELIAGLLAGSDPLATASRVAAVLPVFWLTRWPLPMAAISLPATALTAYTTSTAPSLAVLVPLAICAVLVASRQRTVGYAYAAMNVAILSLVNPSPRVTYDLAGWTFVFVLAGLVGEAARFLRRSTHRVRQEYVRRTQEQRLAIARELHDTTAYDLTALIMALERARIRGVSDPELASDIDQMIALGRQSVSNLRSVLHLLREEAPQSSEALEADTWTLRSSPPLDRILGEAEDSLRRAGLEPSITYIPGAIPISLSVCTVLMRSVQECTANMAKYAAPGSECLVMLEEGNHEVRLLFVNDLPPRRRCDSALGSGLGLVGIRERVSTIGGEFSAYRSGEHWLARISIPRPSAHGALATEPQQPPNPAGGPL